MPNVTLKSTADGKQKTKQKKRAKSFSRKAAAAVLESERKYRQLFESMTEGFLLLEPIFNSSGKAVSYRYLDANPALEKLTQLKRKDIIGRDVREVLPKIEPCWVEMVGRVAVTGKSEHIEENLADLNGLYNVYVYCPEPGKAAVIYTNITEYKRAEEDLRHRAEELERLLEAVPAAVWVAHDPQCLTIIGNRRANEFYEAQAGENVSASTLPDVRRFFTPDGQELPAEELPMQKAIATNKDVWGEELQVLLPSGRRIAMLGGAVPLRDQSGDVRGCIGTFLDISDRKQAEESLRQSERRYRLLHESMRDAFVQVAMDGRIIGFNDAYCEMLGYKPEELSVLTYQDLTPEKWHEFETRIVQEQIIARGYSDIYEKEYRRKDGTVIPVELRTILSRDTAGQPDSMWGMVRDISERKRAEADLRESRNRLQTVLSSMTDGLLVLDKNWRYTYFSEQGARMIGMDPKDLIGGCVWDLFPHAKGTQFYESYHKAVETGQSIHFEEFYPEPINKWIECHCYPSSEGLSVYFRDITGRKRDEYALRESERALRQAKEGLELKVVERTQELADKASKLRALAGELTLTEQRERRRLAKILHDHLQQILVAGKFRLSMVGRGTDELTRQGIKEVEELIDESIRVSRSLTAELSPPILHEAGLKAGLEWLAKRMADAHGMMVDLNLEPIGDLAEHLNVLLFEAARELLFNSFKHAKVLSACLSLFQADGALRLTVSDDGIGFDPESMPRAGESGTGFGLFGIRERLYLLGGKLDVESAPGRGSRFMITVPMEQTITEHPPKQAQTKVHAKIPAVPVPHKQIRLILADDHAVVRQGLANVLGSEDGIEVVGLAANGREAVDLTLRLLPDVVLMDIGMPELNGVEATRIISNEFPDICIIGLSMFEEGERAQAMRDAGASDYLTKSGPIEELVAAIRKGVDRMRKNYSAATN